MVKKKRKTVSEMTESERRAVKDRQKRYHEKHRERIIAKKREHYLANRDKYLTIERDRQYRKRYGITIDDYNRLLSWQDGKCAICSSEVAGKIEQCFAVDHCHNTLKIRGLLCIKCNSRLGWFEANKSAVSKYLGIASG